MKRTIFVGVIIVAMCATFLVTLVKGNEVVSLFMGEDLEIEVLANGESGPSTVISYVIKEGEAMTFYNSKNRWLLDGCKGSAGDTCVIRNDGCSGGLSVEAIIDAITTAVEIVLCLIK